MTLSPVVLSRGALHATGPYRARTCASAPASVATNTPPNGAFRGFGAPQTCSRSSCTSSRSARELGIGFVRVRRTNMIMNGRHARHRSEAARERRLAGGARHVRRAQRLSRQGEGIRALESRRGAAVWKGIGLALFITARASPARARRCSPAARASRSRATAASRCSPAPPRSGRARRRCSRDRGGCARRAGRRGGLRRPTRRTCRTAVRPSPARTRMVVGGLIAARLREAARALLAIWRLGRFPRGARRSRKLAARVCGDATQ